MSDNVRRLSMVGGRMLLLRVSERLNLADEGVSARDRSRSPADQTMRAKLRNDMAMQITAASHSDSAHLGRRYCLRIRQGRV